MTNELFFEQLGSDIENAKTKKTLLFLTNRLKRFINESFASPVSKAYKATVMAGYRQKMKLIKMKRKIVN